MASYSRRILNTKSKPSVSTAITWGELIQMIDGDVDFSQEERKRDMKLWPEVSKITLQIPDLSCKILAMNPLLYCMQVGKLNAFRYFLTGSTESHNPCLRPAYDLNRQYTEQGHTLLHLAILAKLPDFVHLILSYGVGHYSNLVNSRVKDALESTPLHLAVRVDSEEIVTDLLNFGANPLLEDNEGQSSVNMAFQSDCNVKNILVARSMAGNSDLGRLLIRMQVEEIPASLNLLAVDNSGRSKPKVSEKGNKSCKVEYCREGRKARLCHVCMERYCAFHMERHFHEHPGVRENLDFY